MVQKCSFLLRDPACPKCTFIGLTCGALTASAAYATEIFQGFSRLLNCAFYRLLYYLKTLKEEVSYRYYQNHVFIA